MMADKADNIDGLIACNVEDGFCREAFCDGMEDDRTPKPIQLLLVCLQKNLQRPEFQTITIPHNEFAPFSIPSGTFIFHVAPIIHSKDIKIDRSATSSLSIGDNKHTFYGQFSRCMPGVDHYIQQSFQEFQLDDEFAKIDDFICYLANRTPGFDPRKRTDIQLYLEDAIHEYVSQKDVRTYVQPAVDYIIDVRFINPNGSALNNNATALANNTLALAKEFCKRENDNEQTEIIDFFKAAVAATCKSQLWQSRFPNNERCKQQYRNLMRISEALPKNIPSLSIASSARAPQLVKDTRTGEEFFKIPPAPWRLRTSKNIADELIWQTRMANWQQPCQYKDFAEMVMDTMQNALINEYKTHTNTEKEEVTEADATYARTALEWVAAIWIKAEWSSKSPIPPQPPTKSSRDASQKLKLLIPLAKALLVSTTWQWATVWNHHDDIFNMKYSADLRMVEKAVSLPNPETSRFENYMTAEIVMSDTQAVSPLGDCEDTAAYYATITKMLQDNATRAAASLKNVAAIPEIPYPATFAMAMLQLPEFADYAMGTAISEADVKSAEPAGHAWVRAMPCYGPEQEATEIVNVMQSLVKASGIERIYDIKLEKQDITKLSKAVMNLAFPGLKVKNIETTNTTLKFKADETWHRLQKQCNAQNGYNAVTKAYAAFCAHT